MLLKCIILNLKRNVVSQTFYQRRSLWKWVNSIFNKVDYQRIKEVGADQAAAEWLLRCGAAVRWKSKKDWISDYNDLLEQCEFQNVIEEIDATESCIMHIGFYYLSGLKHLQKIKLCKCIYVDDICMKELSVTKESLLHLEVISCGNVSDNGVYSIANLKKLKSLYLFDLPEIKDREECIKVLQKNLPQCDIKFPMNK